MRLLTAALLAVASSSVVAQNATIRGRVMISGSDTPIAGAVITLAAEGGRVLFPPTASPALTSSFSTSSREDGQYEIRDLAPGRYRMHVRRIGYQAAVVDVDLTETSTAPRVSVGLVEVPVQLSKIDIESPQPVMFGRALGLPGDTGDLRPAIAASRQRAYLSSDVRELTFADAIASSASGDGDLFRAFRRLPGVSGFDDYTAELWVRGGRWDQTRVYFDGLPLLNPLRAAGRLTGISGDAIGAAFLHPGVRSVSLARQGASVVDIQSRAAGSDSGVHATGEVSALAGSGVQIQLGWTGSLNHRSASQRYGIALAGRGHFDLFPHYYYGEAGGRELSARADVDLKHERSLTASGLLTTDDATTRNVFSAERSGGSTSSLGRATLTLPVRSLMSRHTVGLSDFESRELVLGVLPPVGFDPNEYPMSTLGWPTFDLVSHFRYVAVTGEFSPRSASDTSRWKVGYELLRIATHNRAPAYVGSWTDLTDDVRVRDDALDIASLWAERRWKPAARLTIEAGARVDVGRLGPLGHHVAPSLQGQYALNPTTRFSAGLSRSLQDQQQVPYVSVVPGTLGGGLFITGGDMPRMVADQASVGIEKWIGSSILLDANLYGRRLANVLVRPLPTGDGAPAPLVLPSVITAGGIELGARKLTGRLTGSIGYTCGQATSTVEGFSEAAEGDRRHALDATVMVRLRAYRIGLAHTAVSGVPYHHISGSQGARDSTGAPVWNSFASAGPQRRVPGGATTDLYIDRLLRFRGVSFAPYLSLQNTLGGKSPTRYAGRCPEGDGSYGLTCVDGAAFYSPGGLVATGFRIVF